jgi:hypothetical protein
MGSHKKLGISWLAELVSASWGLLHKVKVSWILSDVAKEWYAIQHGETRNLENYSRKTVWISRCCDLCDSDSHHPTAQDKQWPVNGMFPALYYLPKFLYSATQWGIFISHFHPHKVFRSIKFSVFIFNFLISFVQVYATAYLWKPLHSKYWYFIS